MSDNEGNEAFLVVPTDAPDNPLPFVIYKPEFEAIGLAISGNFGPWKLYRLQGEPVEF